LVVLRRAAALLCAGAIIFIAVVPANAGPGHSSATIVSFDSHGPFKDSMKDGQSLIGQMCRSAEALRDYSLIFETTTLKKGHSVSEKGKLYFKRPKLMRLEEIGDYNHGAVAVIGKDGKARAHAGGLIRFIVLSLNPTDKLLNAANGDRMIDSDFISLANLLRGRLKQGNGSRATAEPISVEAVKGKVYVLELFKPSAPEAVLKRIYIDPITYLPVRWDDYDYEYPCCSTWWDIKSNVGLSDELFSL
jgi:outer membrane lipoprotein-sorting protein